MTRSLLARTLTCVIACAGLSIFTRGTAAQIMSAPAAPNAASRSSHRMAFSPLGPASISSARLNACSTVFVAGAVPAACCRASSAADGPDVITATLDPRASPAAER